MTRPAPAWSASCCWVSPPASRRGPGCGSTASGEPPAPRTPRALPRGVHGQKYPDPTCMATHSATTEFASVGIELAVALAHRGRIAERARTRPLPAATRSCRRLRSEYSRRRRRPVRRELSRLTVRVRRDYDYRESAQAAGAARAGPWRAWPAPCTERGIPPHAARATCGLEPGSSTTSTTSGASDGSPQLVARYRRAGSRRRDEARHRPDLVRRASPTYDRRGGHERAP